MLALAATLFVALLPLGRPVEAYDTGWNLRLGQWIWQNGRLPDHDPFLSTSHRPVVPGIAADEERLGVDYTPLSDRFHWLGQVLMYLAHDGFGLLGLMLFRYLCFALALSGILKSLRLLEVPALWQLAAVAGAAAWMGPMVLVRPSAVSIALYAGSTALWLSAWRRRSLWRAGLLVAFLPIWAQLHAGFILGQAIAMAFIVGMIVERRVPERWSADRPKPMPLGPLVLLGIAALGVPVLLHPAGPSTAVRTLKAWADTAAMLSPDMISAEMTPANWRDQPATFGVGLLACLLVPRILRRSGAAAVLLTLGSLAMALLSQRNATFFAATSLPLVAAAASDLLGAVPGRLRKSAVVLPLALCLALAAAGIAKAASGSVPWRVGWGAAHPSELARFLRQTPPPGLPFNVYNQGGFLVWNVPETSWFVDGRFINARFLYVYRKFREAQAAGAPDPAWRRVFRHYDVSWAVVPVSDNILDIELIVLLSRAPDWWWVRIEDGTTVFVEKRPSTASYLEQHRLSVGELQGGLERLLPTVASLMSKAGPLIGADYLVSMGAFNEARQVLTGIPPKAPEYSAARQRLERWPAYVGPVVVKLAELEGGAAYRRMKEELGIAVDPP